LGDGIISDLADSFVTGVGKPRVDAVQNITGYFEDLEREHNFFLTLNDKVIKNSTGSYKYHLVTDGNDLVTFLQQEEGHNAVLFLFTIEGMHVLNDNIDAAPDGQSFLQNVQAIKSWQHPPFFITFAHHFYNHLCGHAAASLISLEKRQTRKKESTQALLNWDGR
jgi:hypothetical protein